MYPILRLLHEETQYGRDTLMDLIQPHLKGSHLFKAVQQITQGCQLCARNNPKTESNPPEKAV